MQRPTRVRLVCLGACIVSLPEAERFLRDLGITGPPGELSLLCDPTPYGWSEYFYVERAYYHISGYDLDHGCEHFDHPQFPHFIHRCAEYGNLEGEPKLWPAGGSGPNTKHYATAKANVQCCICGGGTRTSSCKACPKGKYKDALGSAECTNCPAGEQQGGAARAR